jgi:hypothetical protein
VLDDQYYQWKVICILTVDQNWQMAIKMERINKEYTHHNVMREFGLTSWAHTNGLFPWANIPTKKVKNLEIIDWDQCEWDYETATSSHHF